MSWAYYVSNPGQPGRRYSLNEVSLGLGVNEETVKGWIAKGWLRASRTVYGAYLIRHRSVRNCLLEHPKAAEVVLRGKASKDFYDRERDEANRDLGPYCRKGS